MQSKLIKSVFLVISMTCASIAQANPHGDLHRPGGNPGRPPQYQPPRGPGHGPGMGPGHGPGRPRPPMPPPHRPPPPRPRPPMPPPHRPPMPPPPHRPQPPMPPPHQGYWEQRTEVIYVGRAVQNEIFYLRQQAGLDGTYRGWRVVSVRANTSPNSPYTTTATLVADGRVIASQVNPGRMINLNPSNAILDENIFSLQLEIGGSTVIVDHIVIELQAYRY